MTGWPGHAREETDMFGFFKRKKPVATAPVYVWIATYEHKHGKDVRVFASQAAAEAWKQELATEWWDHEMEEEMPRDRVDAAETYFGSGTSVHGETFDLGEYQIET